ncbi:unnamed protein product [Allacma fusca]|uniref:Arf-GAP domain-containing protein n=1 Tax=Allacma fusca TaxID=39272 RepID=A0A8J2NL49_9HEXA|nr:unnamed protein product [Allacma fusca]
MSSGSINGKLKNQEDPNVRVLRDMSHIPANKHCFDCGQRGPTYVNVTIGSFVCMTCSGLLRGLTPPHRVKSISMASFTSDEIELLKSKGNEYCRKVWLATCSAKDSHLGSEKDPARLNLLKDFMSAKYEQKRFYVDPSKLSKTELNEIQAQTARALTSVSQNASTSLSSMQRSPSLSSTRSSGSQQSNPSPLLNNLRNGGNQQLNQQNRLVNSITLPDIKPLTSLIGPAVPSISSNQISAPPSVNDATKIPNTGGPTPINFINNLTSSQQQNIVTKTNNHNNILNASPWSSDSNGFRNGADSNFESSESNFADFEDAFSRNNLNGTNNDLFAGQNLGQRSNFNLSNSTGNGVSLQGPALSSGSIMPPPLLPFNTPGGNQPQPSIIINSAPTTSISNGLEDKYAALKDLDSLFKQTGNGDSVGANGTATTQIGLTSSASLPANLSSSGSSGTGWFSTSSNQNPFSQAPAPPTPQAPSGWNVGATSINVNGTGTSGHNPFFGSGNAWKSPNNNLSNTGFTSGPSHSYSPVSSAATGQPQQQQGFSPGIPLLEGF